MKSGILDLSHVIGVLIDVLDVPSEDISKNGNKEWFDG
jgi:hypothetical protein